MKVKKRKKSSRARGRRLAFRGYKNRTKGSGNRGGYGMAGTGKRGDQRKTLVLNLYGNDYFGKDKKGQHLEKKKIKSMGLRTILAGLGGMKKEGLAKESKDKGGLEIHLDNYKIIGNDKPGIKMIIHAKAATAGAIEAVKHAGGEIIVEEKE